MVFSSRLCRKEFYWRGCQHHAHAQTGRTGSGLSSPGVAYSLGLIIPRGRSVSSDVVRSEVTDRDLENTVQGLGKTRGIDSHWPGKA